MKEFFLIFLSTTAGSSLFCSDPGPATSGRSESHLTIETFDRNMVNIAAATAQKFGMLQARADFIAHGGVEEPLLVDAATLTTLLRAVEKEPDVYFTPQRLLSLLRTANYLGLEQEAATPLLEQASSLAKLRLLSREDCHGIEYSLGGKNHYLGTSLFRCKDTVHLVTKEGGNIITAVTNDNLCYVITPDSQIALDSSKMHRHQFCLSNLPFPKNTVLLGYNEHAAPHKVHKIAIPTISIEDAEESHVYTIIPLEAPFDGDLRRGSVTNISYDSLYTDTAFKSVTLPHTLDLFAGREHIFAFINKAPQTSPYIRAQTAGIAASDVELAKNATGPHDVALRDHDQRVWVVLIDKTNQLFTGSEDKTIKIWELPSGTCRTTLCGHDGAVYALETVEPSTLISGSQDKTIKIWDLETTTCLHTLEGHTGSVLALAYRDDMLISGGADKTVRIWVKSFLEQVVLLGKKEAESSVDEGTGGGEGGSGEYRT